MEVINGNRGRAWTYQGPDPRPEPNLMVWIIEAPWAHPVWDQYALSLAHLRDTATTEPATLYHPAATHEIVLAALDPQIWMEPGDQGALGVLHPLNYVGQFRADDDAAALDFVRRVVRMVTAGTLSPDSDFRHDWEQLFPFPAPTTAIFIPV
jgi:hypothetical protein